MEIDLAGGELPDIGLQEFSDRCDQLSRGRAAMPGCHQDGGASGPRSTPVRSLTDAEYATVRNRSTGSSEGSMPSVTRIGSKTTMSSPCSRVLSRPVISRLPTLTLSVLRQGADGSTVESFGPAIWTPKSKSTGPRVRRVFSSCRRKSEPLSFTAGPDRNSSPATGLRWYRTNLALPSAATQRKACSPWYATVA